MTDTLTKNSSTWPELAIGLYDQLTSRNAEITYEFDQMTVTVPRTADDAAPDAIWKVNGTLRITTRNRDDS